jgi:hypothetical protein
MNYGIWRKTSCSQLLIIEIAQLGMSQYSTLQHGKSNYTMSLYAWHSAGEQNHTLHSHKLNNSIKQRQIITELAYTMAEKRWMIY